jgi:VWFA-related protein
MKARATAALLMLALSVPGLLGQQPTFRAQVELVEIDAVVTDAQGNPVIGLTADDFEITENGKPHPIAAFSTVDIPIERAERPLFSPTAIEPDVQTNQGPEGRVYVLALDDINPLLALRTRRFMRRFIEQHFGTNDVAAIAYLGKGAGNSQDFTSNKRVLLNALDRFGGGFPTEAAPSGATPSDGGAPMLSATQPAVTSEAQFELRSRMKSFRDIAEFMARIPGRRKAMVLISTGATLVDMVGVVDYNGGTMAIELADAHAAMQAASRGNVAIYPIDPRGLTADGGSGESEVSPTQDALQLASTTRLAEIGNLRMLAEVTGGFAFLNQNNFDQAFARLVRENSAYYILGFYSTNERRDGRFRKVEVRVRRPGLEVRARSGYVAPTGRVPPPAPATPTQALTTATSDAFAHPIAQRGVPLKVFAAAYKGADKNASVAIVLSVDPSGLDLVEKDGVFSGELEIATGATSGKGKVISGEYHIAKLALKPDSMERAKREGLQVLTELRLPPGRYQIRAAVGNRINKAGSVVYDVEVPDFSKGPLVMSGVALTSKAASHALTVRPKDPLRDFLPGPATSIREFDASDSIALFVEVYDNRRPSAAHTLDFTATLRADDGRVVQTTSEQRSSKELRGSAGGYGFTPELSLEGAAPGLYVIHLEAQANVGDRPSASRDVQIRIR